MHQNLAFVRKRPQGGIINARFVMAALAASVIGLHASSTLTQAAPGNAGWPTYGFDFSNTRHVDAPDLNPATLRGLQPAWRYLTSTHGRMESTPIIVGDTMYVTFGTDSSVVALDAGTGALRWRHTANLGFSLPCCGLVNRGVAVDGGRVFYATLDARLIALDARTGRQLWQTYVGDPHTGLSETMAPLAWHGLVFLGSSGGELGVRGFVSAYRQRDGRLVWRWWTVSPGWEGAYVTSVHGVSLHRNIARERAAARRYRESWRHGGGAVWMTPALDPRRAILYVSTGNPSPALRPDVRPGDNLYTDSIVALNALTGKMMWFYQETPHDSADYDAASPPVLLTVAGVGRTRVLAVVQAGKTGWLYEVDRSNGRLIRVSQNFVPQTDIYRPPPARGGVVRPGTLGGAIAPTAYDPNLHLLFVQALDLPQTVVPALESATGGGYRGGTVGQTQPGRGELCAINTDTGAVAWRVNLSPGHNWMPGGPLSAGDFVFVPDPAGLLMALDARSGTQLWRYRIGAHAADVRATLGQRIHDVLASLKHLVFREPAPPSAFLNAPPVLYRLNGRDYVAVAADVAPGQADGGDAVFSFALPSSTHRAQL